MEKAETARGDTTGATRDLPVLVIGSGSFERPIATSTATPV